jgi:hypothetical protein
MPRILPATLGCLLAMTALAGCGGGGSSSERFTTVVSTDQPEYAPDETVVVSLTVTNQTQLTVQVTDAWGNFGIYDEAGVLYAETTHPAVSPGPTETFTAGESRLFTMTWHQTDTTGAPAPAGVYEARARLRDDHTADLEATCTFTVLPAAGG